MKGNITNWGVFAGLSTLVLAGILATHASADGKKAAQKTTAGGCVITVTRTACPGKEKESYSKCNGKQSCEIADSAATVQDCAAAALKACEMLRPQVTKSKAVTAVFGGAPVENGKNFCAADRTDFNQCAK